jgi:hypothetical protein
MKNGCEAEEMASRSWEYHSEIPGKSQEEPVALSRFFLYGFR